MSEAMEKPAAQETPAPTPTPKPARMTVDDMIDKYLKLRDKVKAIKEDHTKQLVPYSEAMNTLEAWLLEVLNQAKLKSVNSAHGTAYKTTRTSAKVVDWPVTLAFIRQHDAWDLLEARVSKLAAQSIIDETQHPIPGVEVSSELAVNVRRASASGDASGK
jgi:hypothetical protein